MVANQDFIRSCATCRFFQDMTDGNTDNGPVFGECHRYPPQIADEGDEAATLYPFVPSNDWCGEHKPR